MRQGSEPVRTVGYVGMGIMGGAMANNLIAAGRFQVTIWNRTASKCDALKQQGAAVAGSPKAMAAAGQDRSRSFSAPDSRKTAPRTTRAAIDTGLTQLKVP